MQIVDNPSVVRIAVYKNQLCFVLKKILVEKAVITPDDLKANFKALDKRYPSAYIFFYTEGGLELTLEEAYEMLAYNLQ